MLAPIDGSLFAERHPFRFNSMASKQVGNLLPSCSGRRKVANHSEAPVVMALAEPIPFWEIFRPGKLSGRISGSIRSAIKFHGSNRDASLRPWPGPNDVARGR